MLNLVGETKDVFEARKFHNLTALISAALTVVLILWYFSLSTHSNPTTTAVLSGANKQGRAHSERGVGHLALYSPDAAPKL